MPLSFKFKKSVTLVLIGDNQGGKQDLLTLLHAALSGNDATQFFEMKDTPPTPDTSDGLRYTIIRAPEVPKVQIIDTPEMDAGGTKVDEITQVVKELPTIDAFFIAVDLEKTKLSEGITRTLDNLSTIFPRPIKQNLCFVLTSLDNGDKPVYRHEDDGLPPVENKAQVSSPITNMVKIRKKIESHDPSAKERAIKDLQLAFKRSVDRLQDLCDYVDQSTIQSCEMRPLYLRATGIESEIYKIINPAPGKAESEGDTEIGRLVDEYQLIAASPDFITQVQLVIELLRTGRNKPGVEDNIGKLEKFYRVLQGLKNDASKYTQGYMVWEGL